MKVWLFEYEFEGELWGFGVPAETSIEAVSRVCAMGSAQIQGEVAEKVPMRNYSRPRLVAQNQK